MMKMFIFTSLIHFVLLLIFLFHKFFFCKFLVEIHACLNYF